MKKRSNRVLLVSQYFEPEAFKCNEIAYFLAEQGYRVDVITGIPNYPNGRYFKGYGLFNKRVEKKNGLNIYRVLEIPRGRKSRKIWIFAGYATYAVFGSFLAFFLSLFRRYDFVFAHQPSPVFQVAPGLVVSKMQKIPLYTWVLDLWPSIASYYFKPGFILRKIEKFCTKVYIKSEKILISSEGFRDYIRNYAHVPNEKILYFPNWSEDIKGWPLLEIPSLPNGFRIMMAGNIGEAQIFPEFYELLLKFKGNSKFQWIFVGGGACTEILKRFAKDNEMEDSMTFIERHPFKYMPAFYAAADALLLTLKNTKRHLIITVPARFQSYISAGKPIIGLIGQGTRTLIEEADCGIASDPSNVDDLYEKILNAEANKKIFSLKGENGLRYFYQHFTRAECLNNLMKIVNH